MISPSFKFPQQDRRAFLVVVMGREDECFMEVIAQSFRGEASDEMFFFGDGDGASFFGDDDDDGVGRFAQTDGGAVARAELLVDVVVSGEGEEAAGGIDALMTDDDGAIVRRIRFKGDEEGDEQFFCNLGIDFDALDHILIEDGIFLDGDESADAPFAEESGGFHDFFDGFRGELGECIFVNG